MTIEQTEINISAEDGHSFKVYVAKPKAKLKGAIIVVQEIFGVTNHIKAMCDNFASYGYIAAAPALFDRFKPNIILPYNKEGLTEGRNIRQKLNWEMILADIAAAAEYLMKIQNGPVNIIGYCFGGLVAWRATTKLKLFNKMVGYYGGGIHEYANEKPNCPVMLHFANQDRNITSEHVDIIRQLRPEINIHLYDADHGFNCSERKVYDQENSKLALTRSLAFLDN